MDPRGPLPGSPQITDVCSCVQVHGGGVPGEAGHRLLHLGSVAEPPGSDHHDLLLPLHRLPQTALHQEVHLKLQLKFIFYR